VRLPDVPVTVTVDVPVVAVAAAVSVRRLLFVVGFVLKPAVTPAGSPDAPSVTLLVNPLSGVTVIVLVPLLPCVTVSVPGLAESLKVGAAFTVN
jgi:hypothetical protein